ncbi:MAG: hypothetical protein MJZ34_11420 [Paludibacteraceae bacterium]|nr:hypothetical protein [Paludibacteraceae bacterium]
MDNIKFARLVAKTGVHFGKADGYFDSKEQDFVNMFVNFLNNQVSVENGVIKKQNMVAEDAKEIIKEVNERDYSIGELVIETKNILAEFSEEEQKGILNALSNFIESVISIDGVKNPSEQTDFTSWKISLL